jgi:hypothetical protein
MNPEDRPGHHHDEKQRMTKMEEWPGRSRPAELR